MIHENIELHNTVERYPGFPGPLRDVLGIRSEEMDVLYFFTEAQRHRGNGNPKVRRATLRDAVFIVSGIPRIEIHDYASGDATRRRVDLVVMPRAVFGNSYCPSSGGIWRSHCVA